MSEAAAPIRPRVVVITGVSGAGRRTAAHVLEDLDFYVVDNLPPTMLPPLIDIAEEQGITKVAVILDVRSRSQFEAMGGVFQSLQAAGVAMDILFLEASDQVIVRRQESVRRPLPLQGEGRILEAVRRERDLLADLRAAADMVIDTSDLNVHQLGARVAAAYGGQQANELKVAVMSFGFKNGLPLDADMVLDVRFLPNPHWVPELRPLTGLSEDVSGYVLSQPRVQEYLDHVVAMFDVVAQGYLREGKRLVTLAVGCTGGKHRSTAMSEELGRRLRERELTVNVLHRDVGRE